MQAFGFQEFQSFQNSFFETKKLKLSNLLIFQSVQLLSLSRVIQIKIKTQIPQSFTNAQNDHVRVFAKSNRESNLENIPILAEFELNFVPIQG